MRRALLLIVLGLIALPATALASADQLHGSWKLAAVAVRDVRVEVPPQIDVVMGFDKQKRTWHVRAKIEQETHEATGTWRLQGDQLILGFQGQEAPPMTLKIQGSELSVTMALPEGDRYTIIAKRVAGKVTGRDGPPPAPPPRQPPPPTR